MSISALLESDLVIHPLRGARHEADALTATILDHLSEQTVICLDTLVCLMPQYTWNQIFDRVDQLAVLAAQSQSTRLVVGLEPPPGAATPFMVDRNASVASVTPVSRIA